jgi:hypothetical protein
MEKKTNWLAKSALDEPINKARKPQVPNLKSIPSSSVSQNLFQRVKTLSLWPALFSFAVGYKIGIKSATKATQVAGPNSSVAVRTFVLQASLIALITRELWRSIPNWIKRQIPFIKAKKETSQIDPNDLSSFAALSIKLQALLTTIGDKLDDDDNNASKPPASSLLAMIMLIAQIKTQIPEFRDDSYNGSGIAVPQRDAMDGLDETFEFADEDTLSKALATRKFYLLVSVNGCRPLWTNWYSNNSHVFHAHQETRQDIITRQRRVLYCH